MGSTNLCTGVSCGSNEMPNTLNTLSFVFSTYLLCSNDLGKRVYMID